MSSQRGNVKKSKPPKHPNKTAFKNSMHDTSKRTKEINDMAISGVCSRCKDILEWKIKYKKYKPLTQPKKCTKCQQKRVKHAYHIICMVCREADGICGKCGQNVDQERDNGNTMDNSEEMRQELAYLSERERRTYLRAREKGLASKEHSDMSKHEDFGEELNDDEQSSDDQCENNDCIGNGHIMGFRASEPYPKRFSIPGL